MRRLYLVLPLLVLSACAPSNFDADAWDNRNGECRQQEDLMHQNGLWSQPVCRNGTGAMLWIVWLH